MSNAPSDTPPDSPNAPGSITSGATPPDPIPDHGVPHTGGDDQPTGLPTSDRHHSETAPAATGGDAEAPKHQHKP